MIKRSVAGSADTGPARHWPRSALAPLDTGNLHSLPAFRRLATVFPVLWS